jgi:biotin operon repressor
MSHATGDVILRHGRLALAELAKGPISTAELAKRLKVEQYTALKVIQDLRRAGYKIHDEDRLEHDHRTPYYSIEG